MGVNIGDNCRLYKKCKVCGEHKYLISFPPKGGRRSRPSQRKSYCKDCNDRKYDRRHNLKYVYSFDTSLLESVNEITIRGRNSLNRKYEGKISYTEAERLVKEGAAGIYHSTLIHHFYNKRSLRKFILERDQYICHYCGRYGDTMDHKIPKSKGGLDTPANCVCACLKCNRKKGDMEYDEYIIINSLPL